MSEKRSLALPDADPALPLDNAEHFGEGDEFCGTFRKMPLLYGKGIWGETTKCEAERMFRSFFRQYRLAGGDDSTMYAQDVAIVPHWTSFASEDCDIGRALLNIDLADESPNGRAYRNGQMEGALHYLKMHGIRTDARIFAALPDTQDGMDATQAIARVFGTERTWAAPLRSAARLTDGRDVMAACAAASPMGCGADCFSARDLEREFFEALSLAEKGGMSTGMTTLDPLFTVMPGELTMMTGYPGQGKSELADQIALNLWRQDGGGAAFFSPENRRGIHVRKICEKVARRPLRSVHSEGVTEAYAEIADSFFWICPAQPTIGAILSRAEFFAASGKIKRLVIDPYNEIERDAARGNETETEYISRMLSQVKAFAKRRGVHVFFVAHPKKAESHAEDLPAPGLASISGSQHWVNKADNGISVKRGKEGEVRVSVKKIRDKIAGKLGECVLGYDVRSGVFSDLDGGGYQQSFVNDYKGEFYDR